MSDQLDTKTGWLSREHLENIRANVPLVYVDAVPVRVDDVGRRQLLGLGRLGDECRQRRLAGSRVVAEHGTHAVHHTVDRDGLHAERVAFHSRCGTVTAARRLVIVVAAGDDGQRAQPDGPVRGTGHICIARISHSGKKT